MKKFYSSVDEYLKNLHYLEIRKFTCPLCEESHVEFIYLRKNGSWVTCQECRTEFQWDYKPPQLFSSNREKAYSENHYMLIDENNLEDN